MKKRTLLGLLAVLPLSLLSACGGSDSNDASVRLVNASSGYASLDLYVEDEKAVSAVAYGTGSEFAKVSSGDVTTELAVAGSTTKLVAADRTMKADKKYTVLAYGWQSALKSVLLSEDEDAADADETSVRVVNTATDAGALDVYLTAEEDALDSATPVVQSLATGASSTLNTVESGTYRLRVTAAEDSSDVRLDVSGVVLTSKAVVSLVMTPTTGGVLVNGIKVVQGGDVTAMTNTKARARVIGAMSAGQLVSVAAGNTALATSAKSPAIKSYVLIDAGSTTFNTSVGGSSVASTTATVLGGQDLTVLVTGTSGADAVVRLIEDDNRLPTTSTKFKIRLIHASPALSAESLSLRLGLTDLITEQAWGNASDFVTEKAATAGTLAVASLATGSTVFSLDVADNNLVAKGVYTAVVYDTAAGSSTATVIKDR